MQTPRIQKKYVLDNLPAVLRRPRAVEVCWGCAAGNGVVVQADGLGRSGRQGEGGEGQQDRHGCGVQHGNSSRTHPPRLGSLLLQRPNLGSVHTPSRTRGFE